ncbi:hypothetical protein LCGC14_0463700 [marine sediment metagenome]|uniref:Uncharacterized protein n=1 Tax=marine sediment metagenome TaxID=412755 RepID=A0A0F9SX31_9ZZZZ
MSLNCLTGHIGVEGCTTTTPNSGIFINQLPGIELEMIDKLADEQQVDFNGVWDDVQERAIRKFKTDINAEFKERYKLKNITQSIDLERDIDTTSTTPAVAEYRGFTLELDRTDDNFAYSNLETIYIQTLSLYFTSTNATTIKVFDILTGTELFTQAVPAPSAIGWTTINIYQTFTQRRLFVAYDATLLAGVNFDVTDLRNGINRSQDGCTVVCYGCGGSNRNAELRATQATIATTITASDITFGDDLFGLSGIWSVICSFDGFVCNNKESFTTALWYLLGMELMTERLYTSRLNEFTAYDRNKAKELLQLFTRKYNGQVLNEDGEVIQTLDDGELTMAVDGINLNLNDYCLVCNEPVRYDEAII